jgi:hypothetical protein
MFFLHYGLRGRKKQNTVGHQQVDERVRAGLQAGAASEKLEGVGLVAGMLVAGDDPGRAAQTLAGRLYTITTAL